MSDGFRHAETQFPLGKKYSAIASKERITRPNEVRRTMRPSSVPTAKIKTNAIWARIIRNCLLSLASRYIPNRFSSRLPCLHPYFSSSNYTLLKRWKNLKSPLKRDRFSSLALHRCDTLFISLVLFLSRFISRVFDCVSWCLQRYHPYRLVLSFSLPLFLPILPAYKRFD